MYSFNSPHSNAVAILALVYAIIFVYVMRRINKTGSYLAVIPMAGIFFFLILFTHWAVEFLSGSWVVKLF